MELNAALHALTALSHDTRLKAFRLLVRTGKSGLAAGAIADALAVKPNTLSNHLGILASAGLVHAERNGRVLRYRADYAHMQALMAFLIEDCCDGAPQICAPLAGLVADSARCGEGTTPPTRLTAKS